MAEVRGRVEHAAAPGDVRGEMRVETRGETRGETGGETGDECVALQIHLAC